ncbi:winged helix-turn-helix transcriptional regulator [Yinghuangia soli]|uniref:Helix-turn-helix transcriptional regulator n=1 Tax=Yinghuangia soli TaxID=2908204 RepID=A0AA41PXS9_9ACTN|nr:helix-turn-helix domain-containing protein [Yinghuangia soli]MCF2527666.1 helix-turn-helix transcriptional regulator [Yinghuangia soli]
MQWLDTDPENCPIAHTLDLVGEKWSLLIVRDAANGVRRFDDFRRHVGLSDAVLADRLRKLVGHGVLETRPYRDAGSRARLEYLLTPKGWDLWPVLLALKHFGETHAGDPRGLMMEVRHRDCGAPVRLVAECAAGHGALTSRDAVATPGPAARPLTERSGAGRAG